MIKVLLTDDSLLTREILKDIFHATSDILVTGEAVNGTEAVLMTERLNPDLIIMDLIMPVMDGLTAIEEIMARFPTPILVLSATLDDSEINNAFAAIKRGALDVMGKPGGEDILRSSGGFSATLIDKVRMLARIKVIRRRPSIRSKFIPVNTLPLPAGDRQVLAIGASTGGPQAVMSIVKSLPADFKATTFIVQHIASGFAGGFAQWLDRECRISVRLAVDGDEFKHGEVLVAPGNHHMIIRDGVIRLTQDKPVNCCRPSIDVLFKSLALEQGARVVGVLLSGMGKDGAQGFIHIKERGGLTIAQDERSCAVFGMPKAAIAMNAVDLIVPLAGIPDTLSKIFHTTGDE